MTPRLRASALIGTLLALSACGGSSATGFAPASYDTLDSQMRIRAANLSRFPTTAGARPSGSVTYNGELRITPTIPGTAQDYLGRARVAVNFDNDTTSGSLTNFTASRGTITTESLNLLGGTVRRPNGSTSLEFSLTGDLADSQGNSLNFSNLIEGGVFGRTGEMVQLDATTSARNNNSRNGARIPVVIELLAGQ